MSAFNTLTSHIHKYLVQGRGKKSKKALIVKTNKNTIRLEYPEQDRNWSKIQQEQAATKMTKGTQYVARRIRNTGNIINAFVSCNAQDAPGNRATYRKLVL